jgi:DNA repair protein RadA/Sms
MAKTKTVFFCQSCGAQSAKWMGRCTSCGEWNTFVEEVVQRDESAAKTTGNFKTTESRPVKLKEIAQGNEQRITTSNGELDRVLGGGLVEGSLILVGGEPGIGKSTLMLQIALNMQGVKILYVSGEESEQQLRMRADRLGYKDPDL